MDQAVENHVKICNVYQRTCVIRFARTTVWFQKRFWVRNRWATGYGIVINCINRSWP